LGETVHVLEQAAARGIDVAALLDRRRVRLDLAERFARAYRHYCWPVESLRDIRVAPFHLERLRERGLSGKRSLALREFALGIEGLERFVQREPLRRVHECVFGVLALESEPVDPRL
jgi:PNKP adenylyltransferase domain, ligase domain